MALVHSLEILEKMEDMWKRKLSLPSSGQPVNTANSSIFMEVEETLHLFILYINT